MVPCDLWLDTHWPHTRSYIKEKAMTECTDNRKCPQGIGHTLRTGTDHIPGPHISSGQSMSPLQQRRHWFAGILNKGINDAGKCMMNANENTTGHGGGGGKLQGIELERQTMWQNAERQDCERWWSWAKQRMKRKSLPQKKQQLTKLPLQNTHQLAIDRRPRITTNAPPKPPSYLDTVTAMSIKIWTDHTLSISAIAGASGHADSSSAGPSTNTGSSPKPRSSTHPLSNQSLDREQFIQSLAVAIVQRQRQMPVCGTLGAPFLGGADITEWIGTYEGLTFLTVTDMAPGNVIATFQYCNSEAIDMTINMMNSYW